MNTQTIKPVKEFAAELADAYSADNYRNGWSGCIRMLRKRGYDDQQVEAILRSKWTRWAADASGKPYGHNTGADLERFMDEQKNLAKQVEELVEGTFGETMPVVKAEPSATTGLAVSMYEPAQTMSPEMIKRELLDLYRQEKERDLQLRYYRKLLTSLEKAEQQEQERVRDLTAALGIKQQIERKS